MAFDVQPRSISGMSRLMNCRYEMTLMPASSGPAVTAISRGGSSGLRNFSELGPAGGLVDVDRRAGGGRARVHQAQAGGDTQVGE